MKTPFAFLFALLVGCASGGIPQDAKTTVVSFENLDCGDCGEDMARALIAEKGVYKTAFDKRKAELTVVADAGVDAFALAQSKKPAKEEWTLALGAGKGHYVDWQKAPDGVDVVEVSKDGADVPDLAAHLAKGKVNVVDFSAKWCEPCRALDEHILKMLPGRTDLAYRKLDVGDWDTPLGKRYLVGVKELPYVVVYDGAGNEVGKVSGLDLARLDALIAKAAEKP